MKRILLFLLVVFTMVSGQIQGRSTPKAGMCSGRIAASADGGKLLREVEQQSRRAERVAREAAALRRNTKKYGSRFRAVPNLDTDDKKDQRGEHSLVGPRINPERFKPLELPKIKTLRERMEDSIAENYDVIKSRVNDGCFDDNPWKLFYLANYAKQHNDDEFAIRCIGRIKSEQVTPALLEYVARKFTALNEYLPEISRSVTIYAYSRMLDAKLQGVDCDSARMQSGDTLLIVTNRCNPSLNPLVRLSCFYDPSKAVERYKEAADSVSATYNQWSDTFKDVFVHDFFVTLMDAEEYSAALDYFEREPFKSFPDSLAYFSLDLVACSWANNDNERFSHYLKQAFELDSVAAQEYWTGIYNAQLDYFVADPSQTDVADWLIENTDYPAEAAFNAAFAVVNRYFPYEEDGTWDWPDSTAYTPEQLLARDGIIYILDRVAELDTSNADVSTLAYNDYIKAVYICALENRTGEAKNIVDQRILTLADNPSAETNDVRCWLVFMQAYIVGHGLDKPKEALKMLKKNIKLLDEPDVSDDTRSTWYDYMAALATRMGKTKDANKYLKLKAAE